MTIISVALSFLAVLCVPAAADELGYVVRVDSATVYLDFAKSTPPVAGQQFIVYGEGEELVNPVTGVSLGKIQINVASGTVKYVHPQYAEGELVFGSPKPGLRVQWVGGGSQPMLTKPELPVTKQIWQSQPLDQIIVDIALGDLNGDSVSELVCADTGLVSVYGQDEAKLKLIASFKLPETQRVISVDAADLKGAGREQVFVSIYDSFLLQVKTKVFDLADGKLAEAATLNWLVRAVRQPGGAKQVYAQELYSTGSFDFSRVRQLVFKNGSYAMGGEPAKKPRFQWLYGFSLADMDRDGRQEMIYTTEAGKLRVQFEKDTAYWETPNDFGRTPNRLKWRDDILKFYPRIPVVWDPQGKVFIYGLINISKGGLLADSFGHYKEGKVRRMSWTGMIFKLDENIELEGYAYDVDYGAFAGLPEGLIVPVVGNTDKTVLTVFSR